MKNYTVKVLIPAENERDLVERIEECKENPIFSADSEEITILCPECQADNKTYTEKCTACGSDLNE